MLRLLIWPLIAFAAVLLPGALPAQPAPGRIIAIGDLHGDFDAWQAIARSAGLVDAKGHWTGANATLVQTGDIVDRGPYSLKIIRQLMKLQSEAPRRGGHVIVLVGNHEAMMMTDDLRYVHPGEYEAFAEPTSEERRERVYQANKGVIETAYRARYPDMSPEAIKGKWIETTPLGKIEYQRAWLPDGELGRWALTNPAVVKLGGTLFVHGGISAAYAKLSIDEMNRQVTAALKAQDKTPTAIINNPQGPLWYRGLITRTDGDEATLAPIPQGATEPLSIDQEIDLVLTNYGVKRIVVGHTPSREGILSSSEHRLWRIDSAISRAYGGQLAYLEIAGDKVTAHDVPRPNSKPWGTYR